MMEKVDIDQFLFEGNLPHNNRLFFVKHLVPYVFFQPQCANKKILEIGIGDGFGTYFLSKGSEKAVGLDLELKSYGSLRKYTDKYRATNISFINGNGTTLPFKDASFDRVITCQVIEHIPEDRLQAFLNEISRVLKKGGLSLICTLNVENNVKNPLSYEKFYQHQKEFNRKEFEELLNKAFPKVRVYGVGISLKHRFFRRLKKWGFLRYRMAGMNPVKSFYDKISPKDFKISPRASKSSWDLIGFCAKAN